MTNSRSRRLLLTAGECDRNLVHHYLNAVVITTIAFDLIASFKTQTLLIMNSQCDFQFYISSSIVIELIFPP
ncbi:MAG: hypothetical protein ABI417_13905 [Coleofasciculaceae cyanobacterium]